MKRALMPIYTYESLSNPFDMSYLSFYFLFNIFYNYTTN